MKTLKLENYEINYNEEDQDQYFSIYKTDGEFVDTWDKEESDEFFNYVELLTELKDGEWTMFWDWFYEIID